MPELPEVETTRRDLARVLEGRRIDRATVRERRLRWPVPRALPSRLRGTVVHSVDRRAKYLLLRVDAGTVIIHLGMSGSMRIAERALPPGRHDHFEIRVERGALVRLRDPRRFGAVLWTGRDPGRHRLLRDLGPEPLEPGFDGTWLHARAAGRTLAVKSFLMNTSIVAGVGNIYASEALWVAGVHPGRAAGRISLRRYDGIAKAIRRVLDEAIAFGGTTLRDYARGSGENGTYTQRLHVYGRSGEPCARCGTVIRRRVVGQRATYFCPACQR